ncbi:receptor-type tyrosine-protein phosphatase N2 [Stigmatopora nigra]
MASAWCPAIVVALSACFCCFTPAYADGSYGCLFEDELCQAFEFCVNDGVFGRCQELAVADLNTYDVSSSGLLRLRTLLQKLAHRGLTWQDDITQQVISQELSKLRSRPLGHQALLEAPFGSYDKHVGRNGRPSQAELNLQRFLKGLQFPPQLQPKTVSIQNDGVSYDGPPNRGLPKSGWKETSIYSHQKGADQAPITKVFSKSGEGRHPKLAASYKPHFNQLEQILGGREPPESNGKLRYLGYVRPPPDMVRMDFGSKGPKSNLDSLLFRTGADQRMAKKPPNVMNDGFLQDMMNHLGGPNFNMDTWMTKDLNQLADVITGALHEADAMPQPGRGTSQVEVGDREQMAPMDSNRVLHVKANNVLEANPKSPSRVQQGQKGNSAAEGEPFDKHSAIFSKLLNYLDKFDDSPEVKPATGEKAVGLESVRSKTTQSQSVEKNLPAPSREDSGSRLISGANPDAKQTESEMAKWMQKPGANDVKIKTQLIHVGLKEFSSRGKDRHFGYIITGSDSLTSDQAMDLMERLTQEVKLHAADLTQLSVLGPALTFRVGPNPGNVTTADVVQVAVQEKQHLEKETGLKIVEAGVSDRGSLSRIPVVKETRVESGQLVVLSVLCVLFILVVLLVSATFFCVRQRSHLRMKEKLSSLGTDTGNDATATYQELCRQRMAIRTSERPETLRHSRLNSVSSQFSDGPGAGSPSTRSSTSSWCEEPVPSNMDISTGHMILSYMEDHLKNKNRLEREWEALCSYQAEPAACNVARSEQCVRKNRSDAVLAYDHSRITLKAENNHSGSDYINASPIMDHDPRNPTYIASQGPLPSTVADFWQMVWESGCVVVVMLTPVSENGVKQCHHYWPDEGSNVYHFYEVNLVSEHIWCEDFLVRSFYLKNLHTNETRTVTQFHFLSWTDRGVPHSARTLLDFRRKVNKCYRGRSCPIIVHCSDGAGRSGTYILIDMVLNKMAKGAKEIDIAATLEHLRDQRAGMVQTKEQFEFVLTAVAEEVNAILKAMPQ